MKVSLVQQICTGDKTENLNRSIKGIRDAAKRAADIVVLPELHTTPYFCYEQNDDNFKMAETIPGPSCDRLSSTAKKYNLVIVGSIFEHRSAGVYHNTAVVFDRDGSIAGTYRKMHIPDDPGYNEKFYFSPGDLGFEPIKTSVATLGVLVCWDQWFPEAARLMALAGAEILLYPTAIGWNPHDSQGEKANQLDAWLTIQRGHAIANCLPLLCCNRIGQETKNGETFWGNSFICGPQGELLARSVNGRDNATELLMAEIDLRACENIRQNWPFFRDRRIDAYSGLGKRTIK